MGEPSTHPARVYTVSTVSVPSGAPGTSQDLRVRKSQSMQQISLLSYFKEFPQLPQPTFNNQHPDQSAALTSRQDPLPPKRSGHIERSDYGEHF